MTESKMIYLVIILMFRPSDQVVAETGTTCVNRNFEHDINDWRSASNYDAADSCSTEFTETSKYAFKSYVQSAVDVLNPHRGWYFPTETKTSSYRSLTVSTLQQIREKNPESLSVLFRHFVLDSYNRQPLDSQVLNLIENDFLIVRDAGWTVIVQFCYTGNKTGPPYHDANKTIVLDHIHALGPLLSRFEDIITAVRAGFIGVWGEWYFSTYFGDKGNISESQWQDRKDVVDALLKVLPRTVSVQLRTPYYKYRFWGNVYEPTTYEELVQGTDKSRIGHHNSCFLASDRDEGTYRNKTTEYPYLEKDTRYCPIDGETCRVDPPRSECFTAMQELSLFHWTALNKMYNQDVLDTWKSGGCYGNVTLSLGYRLVLQSALLPKIVNRSEEMNFEVSLVNIGYASPVKDMAVVMVLKSITLPGLTYNLSVPNTDVRTWLPGSSPVISGPVNVSNINTGIYEVYLALQNKLRLVDERYFVIFANDGVFSNATRLNYLNHTVEIASSAADTTKFSRQKTSGVAITSAVLMMYMCSVILWGSGNEF